MLALTHGRSMACACAQHTSNSSRRMQQDPLPRMLEPAAAAAACMEEELGGGRVEEKEFRFLLNEDGCTTEKMAQGIRAFVADTEKLEKAIRAKFME